MKGQKYNLNPHKPALVAMILYSSKYAAQSGGSIDFWRKLSESQMQNCREIAQQIVNAPDEQK